MNSTAGRSYRAGVASILLGLISGAQALILLLGLYTEKVFASGYLRLMCLGEPLAAIASIVCAGIALYPAINGLDVSRRGSATWLGAAGLVISIIASVSIAVLFVIAMGLE